MATLPVYSRIVWQNNTTPAINDTNLNHTEDGLYAVTAAVRALQDDNYIKLDKNNVGWVSLQDSNSNQYGFVVDNITDMAGIAIGSKDVTNYSVLSVTAGHVGAGSPGLLAYSGMSSNPYGVLAVKGTSGLARTFIQAFYEESRKTVRVDPAFKFEHAGVAKAFYYGEPGTAQTALNIVSLAEVDLGSSNYRYDITFDFDVDYVDSVAQIAVQASGYHGTSSTGLVGVVASKSGQTTPLPEVSIFFSSVNGGWQERISSLSIIAFTTSEF